LQVPKKVFLFLGATLGAILSLLVETGEVRKSYADNMGKVNGSGLRIQQVRSDAKKQRDPFSPLRKRGSLSSKPRQTPPKTSPGALMAKINNPNWKLLGIIHGPYGHQAVIQVSPQERVFARAGREVVHSGWIIKNISRGEVLLEHSSHSATRKGSDEQPPFILSFSTLGTSS